MECPSDDDLSSYLAGKILDADAAAIADHVASCRSCDALVEVLGSRPPALGTDPTVARTVAVDGSSEVAPARSAEPRAGDLVGGYVLQHRVGAGGMGVVWAAYDPDLDRLVAIKLIRDAVPALRVRFDQEVKITARLQHPSIVNIFEAATWCGEPYYVMKLVRGETLDRLIATRGALADRIALLASVIAVVDAIAYAHDAGVIHRDLKPENVLVGEFGEAVVIDWGLAKSLKTPRVSAPIVDASAASNETVAGAVIGTPAYMPPEQARGEPVDARADVYALGAILYFVLAGTRPYANAVGDVIAAVLAGAPTRLPGGVPADLAAIVERAMARDASARYPTAKELADDLKRFATGQLVASHRYSARERIGRWVRRHRGAVGVGGIAIVIVATMGVIGIRRILDEKQRATEHQRVAEEQRAEVEKLLAFMLGDLRAALSSIGKLALLDKVATQAETYFEGPHASEGDQHIRFRALLAVGDVLTAKGDTPGALERYRTAETIARAHLALAPTEAQWRRDVAEADSKVGFARMQQGDLPGAVTAFRDGLAITTQLAKDEPGDRRDRDVSANHDLLGSVLLQQGDAAGAFVEFRASLALDGQVAARNPGDPARQRDLAVGHSKLGMALATRGATDEALAEMRAATAIMEKVVAAEPNATEHARDLAVFRTKAAALLARKGDNAAALVEHRVALDLFRQLVVREPENTKFKSDLGNALSYVASIVDDSSPEEALALCREARGLREALVARDPQNSEWQSQLLASAQQTSNVLLLLKQLPAAEVEARMAIAVGKTLVARDVTNTEWQQDLSLSYASLGDILEDAGKRDGALEAQRAGLAISDKLVASDPKHFDWSRDAADRHHAIGDLLATRDRTAALAEYRAALAIVEHLAEVQPTNAAWSKTATELRSKIK